MEEKIRLYAKNGLINDDGKNVRKEITDLLKDFYKRYNESDLSYLIDAVAESLSR